MRIAISIVLVLLLLGCTNINVKPETKITYGNYSYINQNRSSNYSYNESGQSGYYYNGVFYNYSELNKTPAPEQYHQYVNYSYPPNSSINQQIANFSQKLGEFKEWAKTHDIKFLGVNKTSNDFYFNGSKPEDFIPIDSVPNVLEVANGLYKIPEDLLIVMRNKTFYLSHKNGRGYTILGSSPDWNVLKGMDKGAILEQIINQQQAIHEFGHILDYHGIRGVYNDPENHWKELDAERNELFNVAFKYNPKLAEPPTGYMDVYSTANDAENFAQHFAYYVLDGEEFRARMQNDTLLRKKYEFFRNKLFNGKEY